jgi:hypothetical protein
MFQHEYGCATNHQLLFFRSILPLKVPPPIFFPSVRQRPKYEPTHTSVIYILIYIYPKVSTIIHLETLTLTPPQLLAPNPNPNS